MAEEVPAMNRILDVRRMMVLGALLACLPVRTDGQHSLQAQPLPGPLRHAGVYHFATGTWTRGRSDESLGSKVLYANTANTGFFGPLGIPCDIVWTDEGRIPSTG